MFHNDVICTVIWWYFCDVNLICADTHCSSYSWSWLLFIGAAWNLRQIRKSICCLKITFRNVRTPCKQKGTKQVFPLFIWHYLPSESLKTSLSSGTGSLSCAANVWSIFLLLFLLVTNWKPSESSKGVSGIVMELKNSSLVSLYCINWVSLMIMWFLEKVTNLPKYQSTEVVNGYCSPFASATIR